MVSVLIDEFKVKKSTSMNQDLGRLGAQRKHSNHETGRSRGKGKGVKISEKGGYHAKIKGIRTSS